MVDLRLQYPKSVDHVLVKRNRMKIRAAKVLSFLQNKMHSVSSTIATLDYSIVDKNGKIIKTIEQKSNSFVRNYYNAACWNAILASGLGVAAFGDGSFYMKRYTGVEVAFQPAYQAAWSAEGAVADATTGVVVGSNNTAESIEDYAMNTIIEEGVGADQLNFTSTIGWVSWVDLTLESVSHHQRFVANNGSADVTVREVGLVKTLHIALGATYATFLLIRDVITPVTLAPGEGMIVTYNLSYTYPS